MSRLTQWMDRAWYPDHGTNWDDELFRRRLLERIGADSVCLDYGAGRGNVRQMNFRGIARHGAGIDPEPAVFHNPFLDEAAVFDVAVNRIPHDEGRFDVVFADNVMEHVADPVLALREIRRALRPGGCFLAVLRLFTPTCLTGFAYERVVNATRWLEPLRCVLVFELEPPA
jgi:SAM-dependent methyltransferase